MSRIVEPAHILNSDGVGKVLHLIYALKMPIVGVTFTRYTFLSIKRQSY